MIEITKLLSFHFFNLNFTPYYLYVILLNYSYFTKYLPECHCEDFLD